MQGLYEASLCENAVTKICSTEKSSCVDHTDDTADNKHNDRDHKIDHLPLGFGVSSSVAFSYGLVRCCIKISVQRIDLMCSHGTKLGFHQYHANHHYNSKDRVKVIRDGSYKNRKSIPVPLRIR